MSPRVQHFVESRFSVRFGPDADPFASGWLERRVELWKRFCLPSIVSQTAADFDWLVFCDESTDPAILAQLRSFKPLVPALEVALTAADRTPADIVRSRIAADTDILITSWLDSDDALADGFVESVQDYARPFFASDHASLAVNFPRGYQLDAVGGRLYENWMLGSPFPSLFERPRLGPVETVLGTSHVMLCHRHLTQHDESLRAWLIAVHGGNLANRIGPGARPVTEAGAEVPGFSGIARRL